MNLILKSLYLLWWEEHGITGYTWGEPSQRISETYEYLNKIYHHQKPAVVFIETDCFFRDKSTVENLNSIVKSKLANIFPVITFHRNLDPQRISNLFYNGHSLTKGYCLKWGYQRVHDDPIKRKRRVETKKCQPIHPISVAYIRKCIELCHRNGSDVILVSIPAYASWSYKKHNAIKKEAEANHVVYLDLNILMKNKMDWKTDSSDRGIHLNLYGAEKVTQYLGNYLKKNYHFVNHRKDNKYKSWKSDLKKYKIVTARIKKKKKLREEMKKRFRMEKRDNG